ncbi:MAG: hypothetical protein H5U37_02445 [Caldisericia bacterium]|nr:hypothetical protein [Caldisericia bacterium]
MGMPIGPRVRRVSVMILTSSNFMIKGKISVPEDMRFSDALNKFLKETKFIPVIELEIFDLNKNLIGKGDFSLVNKELVVAIYPLESGL